MTVDHMPIRRLIMRLTTPGQSESITGPFDQIQTHAERFAKARKLQLRVSPIDGGALIERMPDKTGGLHTYPEILELAPGGSVVLQVAPISHQRVRVRASQVAAKLGWTLRCMREGEAIRVIRTDGVEAADTVLPSRATKYGLDRLATQASIRFEVTREERSRLRLAVSNYAARHGWTARCRLQDDGAMLVYRTDNPALHPDAQPPFQG